MSRSTHLRPGVDPLVDPRDVAELATAIMSPRDRMLVFLVDGSLVGSLCLAIDLEHDDIAHLFTLVHEATLGTDLRGLVLAERTPTPLETPCSLVAEIVAASRLALRVEAWVRFDGTSVHDVWPLIGPDVTSLIGPDITS
jgi:hypothetical protein